MPGSGQLPEEMKGGGTAMKRKDFLIVMGILAAIITAMLSLGFGTAEEKTWDTCHPMANVNVSWQQTYYSGAWGE